MNCVDDCKYREMLDDANADLQELKDENAKLRKLVRVYRACHDHTNACRGCVELPDCEALKTMRELGQELGIEAE